MKSQGIIDFVKEGNCSIPYVIDENKQYEPLPFFMRNYGSGVPQKNEARVAHWLTSYGIQFQTQYSVKDLGRLRFDFYLPQQDIYIEVQGEQHFNYIPYFHRTPIGFEASQRRDEKKREWAKANENNLYELDARSINMLNKQLFGLKKEMIKNHDMSFDVRI